MPESSKPTRTHGTLKPSDTEDSLANSNSKKLSAELIPQINECLKVLMSIITLAFVLTHWTYFGRWLESATHIEFLGFKVDRIVDKIGELAKNKAGTDESFDATLAKAAIVRARQVSPAIKGAQVLWVDDHPDNNLVEREILEDLGIHVVRAFSTQEATERLYRETYDLVISNVARVDESAPSLTYCPVHYFGWPSKELKSQFNGNLDAFSNETNSHPHLVGGFSLMDRMAQISGAPQIIFYAGANGGKVTSLCTKMVTNQADFLLQSVVTALEERRWQQLVPDTPIARSAP